jgi:hypothetical protein
MSDDIKDNLGNSDNWLRVLLVLMFAVIFWLAAWVLAFVVGLNLLILVITGERNDNLAGFGNQVGRYLGEVMGYATLNSDHRPFPFGEWPGDKPAAPAQPAPPAAPVAEAPKPAKKKASRKKTAKKKVSKKPS